MRRFAFLKLKQKMLEVKKKLVFFVPKITVHEAEIKLKS